MYLQEETLGLMNATSKKEDDEIMCMYAGSLFI